MLLLKIGAGAIALMFIAGLAIKLCKRKKPIEQEQEEQKTFTLKDIIDEDKKVDDWEPKMIPSEKECDCDCCNHEDGHVCQCEECHCHEKQEDNVDEIVFINKGSSASNKYHATPDAHHMDGAEAISRKKAEEQGYVPCGKCFRK